MPKLNEWLTGLAKQAGADINADNFKTVLSNKALDIDLPDDVAGISSKFLTQEAAKNNSDINNFFRSKHLSGVDAHLKRLIKDKDLPQEVLDAVDGEKDTLKKINTFTDSLQAIYEDQIKKAPKGDPELQEKYTSTLTKYNDLNKQIKS